MNEWKSENFGLLTLRRPAGERDTAARIALLQEGERIRVVAEYGAFLLIDVPRKGWMARPER